ncbi:MAG TPA: carboxypeptidase-like regulatory domain-containing protein [Bacteroidales bacterium]|nr:carboxypeptidase-like regulatory domain-containing protein [Bacteroidales bacterium]
MMKNYFFLITLFIISLHNSLWAQTGSIKGTVVTSGGHPAEYVNIGVKNTNKGTSSDKDGNFTLNNIAPGTHTLIITSVGLETKELNVDLHAGESATLPNIVMQESSQRLNEVTVTETRGYKESSASSSLRLNTPLIALPQNIQLVTSKALSDQQIISMSDGVVRNVSGATRIEHWGDLYTNITMRGTQVQAFRNGFNVVSSYWGPLTEDMSFVDHIEFVKGPAGFMLANGDPSGLYNVVTKKPTGSSQGEVSFTAGSFDLYRVAADIDGKLSKNEKLLFRLNVAAQNKNSHRAYEYNNRYSFAPVVSYQLDNQTKVTLEYEYQRAKMSDVGSYYVFSPTGYKTLPVDFTSMPRGLDPTIIDDHSVFVNLQHAFNDNWKITAQTAWLYYQQQGSSLWPSAVNPDGTILRAINIWDAQSTMTMAQVFINGTLSHDGITHNILGGVDLGTKDYLADWGQGHQLDSVGAEFNPSAPNYSVPVNGYPAFDRETSLENRAIYAGGSNGSEIYRHIPSGRVGFL